MESSTWQDWFIPIFSIVLILIFLFLFLYLARNDIFPSQNLQPCGPGLCANDIFTGQKTCPATTNQTTSFDPSFQICSPPSGCDPNSEANCLYWDPNLGTVCPGDPNYNNGLCPADIPAEQCGCVSRLYCPSFATVYFVQQTLSNSTSPSCTNLDLFLQQTVWIDATGLPRSDQPISPGPISSSTNVTCGLPQEALNSIWPPTGCLKGTLTLSTNDDLYYCTNCPACPQGQTVTITNGQCSCLS